MARKVRKVQREDSIVFDYDGLSNIKEQYNRLKDNILYFAVDGKNVIQVESTVSSEGKTTTVANLSVALGLSGKKVVVLDLDFHKARLHRSFGTKNEEGLAEYIAGKISRDAIIKQTKYENVSIINRGGEINNASVVLTSKKLKDLIDYLKHAYDFVVLDCPPVLLVSDFIHIGQLSDGILFAIAYGQTKKKQVKEAISVIKQNGFNIIGAVYTFYDPKKSNSYEEYSYHYGYYYGYGDKENKK